ncbi:MAG: MerR family transcriptional regulator [Ilumatobacteraceae bacterium]
MAARLQIKDVADASGFNANTLRYYEQIGLLPEPARTAAGYRVYDDRTLERLAFIARAKQLGCTLEEITGLTTAWDGGRCGPIQDQLRRLVADKITAAQRQLAELVTFTSDLQHAATTLEGHRPEGPCDGECGCVADPEDSTAAAAAIHAVRLSPNPVGVNDEPAIACTLSAGSVNDRIDDWTAVLRHVDRRESIDGGIRSVFAESVSITALARLVAAEQDCCQFFRFAITVDTRGIALEVRAPGDAQLVVESMFGRPT